MPVSKLFSSASLSRDELEGVLAHELMHVKHRDILISTVAATLAAAIMFLGYMARFGAIFAGGGSSDDRRGPSPIAILAMALLAPFAAMLIQMAVSRQREYAADRGGATLVGSPTGLANALRRIDAAIDHLNVRYEFLVGELDDKLRSALGARRDDVIVATKFGVPINDERKGGASAAYVAQAVDGEKLNSQ